jgi:5'-3' exonuclease
LDKILFIDGHNAMWRACQTFGPKITNHVLSGDKCICGAAFNKTEEFCYGDRYVYVFNFFRNLRPIIELFSPDKCFFVLEGHPQFRYDLYADYKANRIIKQAAKKEVLDKFYEVKKYIIDLLKLLPITQAVASDYECDDVISSLCENLKSEDLTILSSDSDYIQLLQLGYSNIKIYNPIKKEYMVAPEYPYVIWKCLNGDKSDNIPGVLKPKKALEHSMNPELFQKFMDVEENRANFSINRQLIEFKKVPEEDIIFTEGQSNFDKLFDSFAKMKFDSITNPISWEKYCKTFSCIKY